MWPVDRFVSTRAGISSDGVVEMVVEHGSTVTCRTCVVRGHPMAVVVIRWRVVVHIGQHQVQWWNQSFRIDSITVGIAPGSETVEEIIRNARLTGSPPLEFVFVLVSVLAEEVTQSSEFIGVEVIQQIVEGDWFTANTPIAATAEIFRGVFRRWVDAILGISVIIIIIRLRLYRFVILRRRKSIEVSIRRPIVCLPSCTEGNIRSECSRCSPIFLFGFVLVNVVPAVDVRGFVLTVTTSDAAAFEVLFLS